MNIQLFLFAVSQQGKAGLASSCQLPTHEGGWGRGPPRPLLDGEIFAGLRPASGWRLRFQPTPAARRTRGTARGAGAGSTVPGRSRARPGEDGSCGCGAEAGRRARSAARPTPRGAGEGCPPHVTAARDKCPAGREPGGESWRAGGRRGRGRRFAQQRTLSSGPSPRLRCWTRPHPPRRSHRDCSPQRAGRGRAPAPRHRPRSRRGSDEEVGGGAKPAAKREGSCCRRGKGDVGAPDGSRQQSLRGAGRAGGGGSPAGERLLRARCPAEREAVTGPPAAGGGGVPCSAPFAAFCFPPSDWVQRGRCSWIHAFSSGVREWLWLSYLRRSVV